MIDIPPDSALLANTPRLRLVPLLPEDAPEMAVVLADESLYRFTGGSPPQAAELAERYRRWQARRSPDGEQLWLNWVVRLVPLGEAIGHLQATVTDDGSGLIAYVIGSPWSGHGLAVEASRAMVGLLEAHAGVRRLVAHIHPEHVASQRVAARLGLRRSGRRDADGEEIWEGRCGTATTREERARRERQAAVGRTP